MVETDVWSGSAGCLEWKRRTIGLEVTDDWGGNDGRLESKRRPIGLESADDWSAESADSGRVRSGAGGNFGIFGAGLDKISGEHICCEHKELVRLVASEVGECFTPARY